MDNYSKIYYNDLLKLHRIDGPAVIIKKNKSKIYINDFLCPKQNKGILNFPLDYNLLPECILYFINGIIYFEEDYWKHPDVIAYQKLKELL